jgi:diguanylate cyclase (GGDEF)-like protein/putative nucleotidyltransferase with HDIG domain
MPDRHGVDAVDRADAARSWLVPGVSAEVARRGLVPGYLLVVAAYVALEGFGDSGAPGYVAGQLVWLGVAAALTRAAWVAYGSGRLVERRFWGWVFAAGACATTGQITYLAQLGLSGVTPPLESISTVFDIGAVVSLVAMLASLARFRRTMFAARARFVVDVIAACVVTVGVLDAWVVGPMYASLPDGSIVAGLLYSFYPVVGVLVLAGTLRIVIGTRPDRWMSWERLIGAASGSLALALIVSPWAYSDLAARITNGWAYIAVDAVLLTSLYLGFAAVVHRLADSDRPWGLRPLATLEPSYGWVASVVLPSIELIAIPAFGVAAFGTTDPSERLFRFGVVAATAALLALRTVFAVADSESLLARADTDPLTGLFNHRIFYDRLGAEIERAHRHGETVGLIALDIDDFGSVNSVGGHLTGDAAIVSVARAVVSAVRLQDVVCRVGGDELMVIISGADAAASALTARRVLDGIRDIELAIGRGITASAGIAVYPTDARDRDELVRRADAALYWAKRHGKDRAVVFDVHIVGPVNAQDRIRDVQEHANLDAVRALAAAVDARDPGTQDHSRNVAALSTALARELGLDEETVMLVGSAGLLHDVGKIGVPDAVLHKRGELSDQERAMSLMHGPLGAEILSATAMADILPWVRHHHERWDGTGAPDGLSGEAIPLGARIIAIGEAYDSLVTGRHGRKPLTPRAALQQIDMELGAKFDPIIGERFLQMAAAPLSAPAEDRMVQ